MVLMPNFQKVIEHAMRACIPLEVSIELTHQCNFRCKHCYIPDFQAPNLLTTERILGLLDELAEMGTLFLSLTGGEVFLRKDWALIARRARELNFHLTILTNGALLDDAVADTLAQLHAFVDISFHADDREVFESITQRPGSFDATVAAIHRVHERGMYLKIKIPVMNLNQHTYPSAIEFAEKLGVEWSCSPKILTKTDGEFGPVLQRVSGRDLTKFMEAPTSGCHVVTEEDAHPAAGGGPLCAAGVRYAAISASGDVLACNVMPGSAGNVLHSTFREIWEESPWLRQIRRVQRADLRECATCSKFSYCNRCPAQALVEDGDLLGLSRDACKYAEAIEAATDRKGRIDVAIP